MHQLLALPVNCPWRADPGGLGGVELMWDTVMVSASGEEPTGQSSSPEPAPCRLWDFGQVI